MLFVSKVWSMLMEEDILPEGGHPKHLLWALHFLKVYPLQAPGCAAVGASGGAVDPKTHRKWVWAFIDAIEELVDNVVSKSHVGTGEKMASCRKCCGSIVASGAAVDGDDGACCGRRAPISSNLHLSVYADVFFSTSGPHPPRCRYPRKRR